MPSLRPAVSAVRLVGAALSVILLLADGAPSASAPSVTEILFDSSRGLGSGWRDLGWAPRELPAGRPALLDFSDRAGWILARPGLMGSYGGVLVLYRAPAEFGDFLEVSLNSPRPGEFPRVPVGRLAQPGEGGFTEILVPMSALDPRGLPF